MPKLAHLPSRADTPLHQQVDDLAASLREPDMQHYDGALLVVWDSAGEVYHFRRHGMSEIEAIGLIEAVKHSMVTE